MSFRPSRKRSSRPLVDAWDDRLVVEDLDDFLVVDDLPDFVGVAIVTSPLLLTSKAGFKSAGNAACLRRFPVKLRFLARCVGENGLAHGRAEIHAPVSE